MNRTGVARLDALLADETIDELLINEGGRLFVERHGAMTSVEPPLRPGEAGHALERILAPLGLRADPVSPIVEARLGDGSRVHAVVPPVSMGGPTIAIRRFAPRGFALRDFCSGAVAKMLSAAVERRANLLVAGATSTGKTSLLNALASHCRDERVITIEDAAELRLPGTHVVRLEARRATADGFGEVTVRDLVKAALRLRPDRLVVGEVRGGEALDMLLALTTGHDGSMTTVHARTPHDALARLSVFSLMASNQLPHSATQELVHRAIDLVVFVERGPGGKRRVASVTEVADDGTVERLADGSRVLRELRTDRATP